VAVFCINNSCGKRRKESEKIPEDETSTFSFFLPVSCAFWTKPFSFGFHS